MSASQSVIRSLISSPASNNSPRTAESVTTVVREYLGTQMEQNEFAHIFDPVVQRQFHPAEEYIRHHTRPHHLMSVKRPPRRRVVSFRCRLADIVKNSRPAEPQAVAVECHVVQYLQCMSEVIFMSVQSHLFHAFKPTHLRKYKRQQTGHIHQFETDGGHRRKDYLVYLGNNALAGNYPDTLPVAFDGLEGLRAISKPS